MAGDERDATFDLIARDKTARGARTARENMERLRAAARRAQKSLGDGDKTAEKFAKRLLTVAKAAGRVAATAAAAASAVGPLVSGLVAAGKATAAFGRAAVGLAPLVAFLPSLAGAAGLLVGTLKLAGPGLVKALKPITEFFTLGKKGKGVGSLTTQLQTLIAAGVEPLARQFAKVNLPTIGKAMERIAVATNGVVRGFGAWLNSAEGQGVIKTIAEATAVAFERLAPKVTAAAIAFGRLAGRAGDKAITGLADLIGRIVDRFTAWADSKSVDDINGALSDLSGYGTKIKTTFEAVRDIGGWMASHVGAVKAFSDAVAGAAIALGAATGNIPAVLAGSFALVLNHFSDLKSTFTGAGPWMSDLANRWKNDAGRIKIAEGITNALQSLKEGFASATKDIGPKWTEFVRQVKNAWQEWAPLIAIWWNQIGAPVFALVGKALGVWVMGFIDAVTKITAALATVGTAFKVFLPKVLDVFGAIVNGAANAFGWMPEIGPKLRTAAAEFNAFRDSVNRALAGIDDLKIITIRSNVYIDSSTPGNRKASGGVDQRTGNSRNAGLSGLSSWRPAEVAAALFGGGANFAMAGGATSRTGGPVQVTSTIENRIYLDGRPFREYVDEALSESERRQAWRAKVGRR